MIHERKKTLLERAAGVFERGGKLAAAVEIAEDRVRDLQPCMKIMARCFGITMSGLPGMPFA
jgi:hypothetical protein